MPGFAPEIESAMFWKCNRKHLIVFAATLLPALSLGCREARKPIDDRQQWRDAFRTTGVVLPLEEGPQLLTSCDGKRVEADSLWSPPDTVLRVLEVKLASRVRKELSPNADDPLRAYHRQYLGIYRAGKALILINGVHDLYLQNTSQNVPGVTGTSKDTGVIPPWFATRAVVVCDGGEAFFRAEYDVGDDTIIAFAFNQRA
jgi:hypothetical protein